MLPAVRDGCGKCDGRGRAAGGSAGEEARADGGGGKCGRGGEGGRRRGEVRSLVCCWLALGGSAERGVLLAGFGGKCGAGGGVCFFLIYYKYQIPNPADVLCRIRLLAGNPEPC